MTREHESGASAIARDHLLTGVFGTHVDRIEAHRIELQPGQKAGRHVHPGGVVGYVEDGDIIFELAGQPATTLRRGSVFCEPPGATITRFDNASDTSAAAFVAFYPLSAGQPLISMLDQ